jgi:hypothetical protein
MLIVIATTSVICALATSLIITMFRAGDSQSRDANERRAIQRLGDQFRSDVHAAQPVATVDTADDVLLRLPLDDDVEVAYRRAGGNVVREQNRDGAVVYRDTFGISDRWQVSVEPDATNDLLQLSLVRTETMQRSAAPARWRFDAAWGRDHRHRNQANQSE